jgi:REP element-mobilizing transposase RayT
MSYSNKYRTKSIRLPDYDYRKNGGYFVTICTQNRICCFGNIKNNQVQLSSIGKIAQQSWIEISKHFNYVYIDAFIIMPNHIHGVIIIDQPSQNIAIDSHRDITRKVSTNDVDYVSQTMSQLSPKAGSLSVIIRSYKATVTRRCKQNSIDNFSWQPRFYEHIIRDQSSLDKIREYIINNPIKWHEDQNNPVNIL